MPKEIDTEALNSKKVLDISTPPTKEIPFQEFPKLVYLHPKDKSKEHIFKKVHTKAEEEEALAVGYRLKGHVPQIASGIPEGFEPDVPGEDEPAARRGRKPKEPTPTDAA